MIASSIQKTKNYVQTQKRMSGFYWPLILKGFLSDDFFHEKLICYFKRDPDSNWNKTGFQKYLNMKKIEAVS